MVPAPLLLLLLLVAAIAAGRAGGAAVAPADELPQCEEIPGTIEEGGECVCEDRDQIIVTTNNEKHCVTVAFEGLKTPCVDDLQCPVRLGDGAVCAEKTNECSCGDGHHYLHGRCWRTAGPGAACAEDAACAALGEWDAHACVAGVCACAPGAHDTRPDAQQPLCRRRATVNEECESALDCIDGLECGNPTSDPRGTHCHEPASYSVFNTSIHGKRAVAGGSRAECADEEEATSGGRCACRPGLFRPSAGAPCVPELGEACSVGEVQDDIPYSLCRRSAKAPLEDDAGQGGVWACQGGFAPGPDNRECLKTRKFSFNCEADSQCGYYGGVCVAGKCVCAEKHKYLADRQLCWPTSAVGEACTSAVDCAATEPEGVRCDFGSAEGGGGGGGGRAQAPSQGVCACVDGFHAAQGECRRDALALGQACVGQEDCLFAEGDLSVVCAQGRCACRDGYSQYNSTICLYEVSTKCDLIEGAVEEGGECVCENRDYVINGARTKCIQSAWEGAGAPCAESAQCQLRMGQGANCTAGACACAQGYHYLHGQCWRTRAYGEACSEDAECYQFAESDAYACVDNECTCAPDASARRPNGICRRNARDGEECESTLDCVGALVCDKPSTNALDVVCQEPARRALAGGARPPTGRRVRPSEPRPQAAAPAAAEAEAEAEGRLKCGPNEQLTPSHSACMCQRGYWRPSSAAACVPELGEPCFVGEDPDTPRVEYAACRRSAKFPPAAPPADGAPDGVWACFGGFVALPDNRECEKTRQNNFNCQVDGQCGYYGGFCNVTRCACEENHHYVADKLLCWPTKGLDAECESDADCNVETANSVHCYKEDPVDTEDPTEPEVSSDTTEGVCRCRSGYHKVDSDCRKEANKLTDSCVDIRDCVFAIDDPLILCDSRQCSCKTGYFPFNQTACQTGVGGECSTTRDCSGVPNTVCLYSQCTCQDGYVRGSSSRCIPIATEYGDECEDNDQCTHLAPSDISCVYTLESATCSCARNMHYLHKACWYTKYLYEGCKFHSECIVENSVCRNNYCACEYGFADDGFNRCVSGSPVSVAAGSALSLMLVALASRFV